MDKLVKIILFSTALSSSVFSAPNEIFFEKVISGGENIVHVEPILDMTHELSGFLYTDSALNKIYFEQFEQDSSIVIEVPVSPLKTIIRYSELRDTLYMYTLSIEFNSKPQITVTKFYEQFFTQETFIVPTNVGYSGYPISTFIIEHFDFRFYPNAASANQIIFEYNFRVNDFVITMGQENYNVPTSIIYNLDLSEIILHTTLTSIHPAYLFSEESPNYIFTDKSYYSWNFVDFDSPHDFGTISNHTLSIHNTREFVNSQLVTSYNKINSIHVDNFAPSSATDELIIHSNSVDLLDYYDREDHIACYSFTDGSPVEIWYNNEVAGINFSHVFPSKDLLVGIGESNEIITLNYLNGEISDSTFIDENLEYIEFFETGFDQSILNLVGMNGDTVKVYRFDIATDLAAPTHSRDIPQTFSLLQNQPNPFNGETRLEFSNTKDQFLKLSIFNILGQEIKVLAASKFAAGSYSYYWDGYDSHGLSQATGIYFARLESEAVSQMIKLIYLK